MDVQMMGWEYQYPFALDFDWRALDLPFAGARMGMVFVLPKEGGFDALEASFDAELVGKIVDRLEAQWADPCMVWARVPRFNFASDFDLAPSLRSPGKPTAFDWKCLRALKLCCILSRSPILIRCRYPARPGQGNASPP